MKTKLILIAFVALLGASCSPTKYITETKVKTEYKEILRDTTVYVELPREVVKVFARDTARAEINIARAEAFSDTLGLIHLNLESTDFKPKVKVAYKDVVFTKDSLIFETKEILVPVQIPLTWWQKFRMNVGGWLLAATTGLIIWWLIKKFV